MKKSDAIFSDALADLERRMKVKLSEMRPGEVAALVRACDRVASPYSEVDADAAGMPVRVADGVHFWKLTIGASVWLDDVEAMLPRGRANDRYKLALIYAVRHGREPEAFAGLDTVAAVERAVKKDFRTIAATPAEVNAALESVLGLRPRPPSDVEDAAISWAALCARLETQTGIPAQDWIWKHSSAYAVKCYYDLHDFARAYCSAKGSPTRHMADELDDAVNALQRLKVEIRDRVRGDGDGD